MTKLALIIFIFCFAATFSAAQKTVRKKTKTPRIETSQTQTPEDSKQKKNSSNSSRFDTPVVILEKPRASYPSQTGGTICVQGKVVLRVTFLSSGEIGAISVISGLGNGLTEQAIEAAKKIKFEPATKDGKPVTVAKPVEYAFTIY